MSATPTARRRRITTGTIAIAAALAVAAAAGTAASAQTRSTSSVEGDHCLWKNTGQTAIVTYRVTPSIRYGDASALRALQLSNYGPSANARITIFDGNTGNVIGRFQRYVPNGASKKIAFPSKPEYTIPWGSTLKAVFTAPGGQRCTLTMGM